MYTVKLYIWQSHCVVVMQSLNHKAVLLSPLTFNSLQAHSVCVSASLPSIFISYLRLCLELVRSGVTGCVSALWPLNPGLTEPEQGTVGNTAL